jgi:hypothetical protein
MLTSSRRRTAAHLQSEASESMRVSRESWYCAWVALSFIVSGVVWYGLVQLQAGVPTGVSEYYYSIIRYKSAAARRAGTPKIVLLGASATYHGIRADVMARQLGVPTVNLGLTASLGSRYIMWNAERDLKPGDSVLLTLEYFLLFRRNGMDPFLVDYIYARDPSYIGTLPVGERLALPLRLSPYRLALGLINRINPSVAKHWLGPVRNPLRLTTPLGDAIYETSAQTKLDIERVTQRIDFDPRGPDPAQLADIAEFASWCHSHGVRLVLSYPPFAWGPDLNEPSARAFLTDLERFYSSTGALVQGKPEDFFYAASWFQDTRVHLKTKYAEQHTLQRVELMRPLFRAVDRNSPPRR